MKRKIIFLTLLSFLIVNTCYAGQLSGWDKRKKITIDSTKVDSDVTHFPVVVIMDGDTDFFGELGAGQGKKVAFTKADGETQLYGELEEFDAGSQKAVYHVSKSDWTISSASDTVFYIYYDSTQSDNTTYIGDPGDSAAQNVWDANFRSVYHMKDLTTSTIADSKGGYTGTKLGANQPIEASGKVGKAQDFDGTNDIISNADTNALTTLTVEAWVWGPAPPVTGGANTCVISRDDFGIAWDQGNPAYSGAVEVKTPSAYPAKFGTLVGETWYYLAATYDLENLRAYKDGTLITTNASPSGNPNIPSAGFKIGSGYSDTYDGLIDELRISTVVRSADWIKAAYNSQNDSLVSFGGEAKTKGTVLAIF